ncbi:hypothetical protein AVEN_108976-1 [Araneus ventricosus]|uniref:Uncharacterized protein n=1 Tax=Araneus ventricosus TaxID=182803 RepID=A0A4Y2F610_ARAVE|nr:hypothetical protein AVEN_108976-1 [Araneus ventricosus]
MLTRSPRSNLKMKLDDVNMILSTSLKEVLSSHIKDRIEDELVCNSCLENQVNQLGHECITLNHESRHSLHGDLAILSIDNKLLEKTLLIKMYKCLIM